MSRLHMVGARVHAAFNNRRATSTTMTAESCAQGRSGRATGRRAAVATAAAIGVLFAAAAAAQPQRDSQRDPAPAEASFAPWGRIAVERGQPVDTRPFPPKKGRNRCIAVKGIAGAQLFGDSAIELSMRDGRRFRMFFARECQALSFYQGFYYRRARAGQICAGRDVIGARSGGECPIASIIEIRPPKR
jgi:hypothetical protein